MTNYTKKFEIAIFILFIVALIGVFGLPLFEFYLVDEVIIEQLYDVKYWAVRLMWITPLAGPLLWWAGFCGKRRKENVRLEEEYAHKETLAKSYESYKSQIDKLQTEETTLQKKLLETAIEAIGRNPSETLEKSPASAKFWEQTERENK